MIQLLIQGAAILAQGPFVDDGSEIGAADAIYPKHVLGDWQIVEVEAPAAFSPAAYTWDGVGVVLKPALAPVVPDRIPMLNAHLVLIEAGWIDGINAYIDAMPDTLPERDRSKARAYFNLAQTMDRTHPLVLGIPAALGKTEAEVDALFIEAGALNV